jgi:hypothetical protein
LPRGVQTELIGALLDAATEGPICVPQLAPSLSEDARALLHALSVEGEEIAEANAARTVDDTLAWLRAHRRKHLQRDVTRRIRSSELGADEKQSLLEEKQRQLRQRREDFDPVTRTSAGHRP